MKNWFARWASVAVAATLLMLPQPVRGQSGTDARVPAAVRDAVAQGEPVQVIVRVREAYRMEGRLGRSAATAQRARIRDRIGQVMARQPGLTRPRRFRLIPAFAAQVDAATLAQLAADPDVAGIEIDRRMRADLSESGPLVGAPQAWAAGYTGSGWTVAVLDTGVDAAHPFLVGKVVAEACYSNAGGTAGGTSLCPGGVTATTAPGSGANCAFSGCDHGTHVAGIAAGRASNVSGIARDAALISMQVFTRFDTAADCGFQVPCLLSYVSDEILALERVFALKDTYNIAAVNMSLGGGRYFSQSQCDGDNVALKAAIDQLRSVGVATVASSGNDGYFNSMSAPACLSSAVSVGATTKADSISNFSNTASFLHLLAPGSSITSSVPGGFDVKSGTSMAAPHVSAAWALLKQRRPTASVAQILSALQSTGLRLTDSLNGFAFPRVRVNAAATALHLTQIVLDMPVNSQTVSGSFTIAGWALDRASSAGTGVDAVHVYAYPASGNPIFLGVAAYGGARADLGGVYGARFTNTGFSLTAQGLTSGTYQLIAYAHSAASGAFDGTAVARVTVPGAVPDPQGVIETPLAGATVGPAFTVAGWSIDRGSPIGTGVAAVHVYAYPNPGSGAAPLFLGVATYGSVRGDVGAYFGSRFTNAGYTLAASGLAPGNYRLVVYSHSTVSGLFSALTRDITVRALGDPLMTIDTPVASATVTRPFVIAGWAIDRDATTGTGIDVVHVWAYPVGGGAPLFLGAASYGGQRSDVAAVFGANFVTSGYDLVASGLPAGLYDIVVYPRSVVTGNFAANVIRVLVQ